jgi:predicted aspartyl protease
MSCGENRAEVELLLNSGGRGTELAIPKSLAKKIGLNPSRRATVIFGGSKFRAPAGEVKVEVENPKTGEKRGAVLEAVVLPDKVLDCALLGVVGQEKLRVAPNTPLGEPIFV